MPRSNSQLQSWLVFPAIKSFEQILNPLRKFRMSIRRNQPGFSTSAPMFFFSKLNIRVQPVFTDRNPKRQLAWHNTQTNQIRAAPTSPATLFRLKTHFGFWTYQSKNCHFMPKKQTNRHPRSTHKSYKSLEFRINLSIHVIRLNLLIYANYSLCFIEKHLSPRFVFTRISLNIYVHLNEKRCLLMGERKTFSALLSPFGGDGFYAPCSKFSCLIDWVLVVCAWRVDGIAVVWRTCSSVGGMMSGDVSSCRLLVEVWKTEKESD